MTGPTLLDAAEGRPSARRLFVALWPGDAERAAVGAAAQAWTWSAGARPVAMPKLHLTLHFLGPHPETRFDALAEAVDMRWAPAELVLDRTERWSNGVAVLLPSVVPPALTALQHLLGRSLERIGLKPEPRPWRPHVTLARDARGSKAPEHFAPVRWPVAGHALVESLPEGGYRVLRQYDARPTD